MVINIQNILSTSQLSFAKLAVNAEIWNDAAKFTNVYYINCMKQALCTAAVIVDKTERGVCVCSKSLIPDSCEIELICIDKDFRRIGLGRKLLSHVLRNMRCMRVKTAYLWVNENNTAAVGFFTNFGFTPDGKRRKVPGDALGDELRLRIDIF